MKKIIVAILVVGCLLTTSIAAVNAAVNPNQDEYANEENAPVPAGSSDFIDPIYYKKWDSTNFDKAEGVASTLLNGYLYVLAKVSDIEDNIEVNEHVAILKFLMDDGMLKESVILDDPGIPRDIVAFKGYIYAIALLGASKKPALLKINANDLSLEKRHDISGGGLEPEDIDVNDNYIYVAGNADAPFSIFLAKFDENCNPDWKKYYSEQEIQAVSPDGDGIAVYDNHIYLTGTCMPIDTEDIRPFILKYDADSGALVDELIINENSCLGFSVEGRDGKIYACISKWDGILEAFDLCVKIYNTDLDLLLQKTFELDAGLTEYYFYEWGCNMVFLDNYLYICGRVLGISGDEGFVLKCGSNNLQKEWFKRIQEHPSWVYSIHVDADNKLYLSGWVGNKEERKVFILKCNHNGGKNLALTVPVNLDITQQSSQQYTTTTSTTISGQSSSQSIPLSNPLISGSQSTSQSTTFGLGGQTNNN